jgi:hypothetical protein
MKMIVNLELSFTDGLSIKSYACRGEVYNGDLTETVKIMGKSLVDLYLKEEAMSKKFIQKAVKNMEEKGTKGAFTAQAKKDGGLKKGGGIKTSFIEKELKSSNPKTRKRAAFAKVMKSIAKGK